jgi:CDP-4-dehydro-6-deoxyglucose reductase
MSFQVSIQDTEHRFTAEPDQSVLKAALAAGFIIPYSCQDGACGSCKGRLVSGDIDYGNCSHEALSEEERAQGLALFCQAKARSDLVIKPRELRIGGDIEVRKMPMRVLSIQRASAPDVVVLKLQPPATMKFDFYAGQYLDVLLRDGTRRSFSMGNAPEGAEAIELHVRQVPGGNFTDHVFNKMKEREILRVEAPLGTFYLREESPKPVVFVASGTGFAPIKSIIESSLHAGIKRPMTVYWGGRRPRDLYMSEVAEAWAKEHDHIQYVPVISEALPEDNWSGRDGFVHRAVMQDFPDLSGYQVYACGVPIMVDSARRDFVAHCKLPEEEFFADSFTTAADVAK